MSEKAQVISFLGIIAAIILAICIFIPQQSQGAESAHTGHIKEDTRICSFAAIRPDTVSVFETFDQLIDRLEEVGLEGLSPVQRQLGNFLTIQVGCGTVAEDYRVVLDTVKGEYILFIFDPGYGFDGGDILYLTRLSDFHPDEVL